MNPTSVPEVPLPFLIGIGIGLVILAVLLIIVKSLHKIGATQRGLVNKRFSTKKLVSDNPIAFDGEAGYQAELLSPGLRFKLWPFNQVTPCPVVQVPAGQIGVVIAQIGEAIPIGAKSAVYKDEFGDFTNPKMFIGARGEKGVQRPVLRPGANIPIHPAAFLVITQDRIYGVPIDPDLQRKQRDGQLSIADFGLQSNQLAITRIEPLPATGNEGPIDTIGIVTTYEGNPLDKGDIASRLGGFDDIAALVEDDDIKDPDIIEVLLGSKNAEHNSYQDFQAFLDKGGRIGLQHDAILYGAYALNPFLVSVEIVPMLVVEQGEVAVIKGYVGLTTEDTSGYAFKHGMLVRPGRRGIWQEALRTGKYPINPRCYAAEIVHTAILTLNWADAISKAHDLDKHLSQITAKSEEGFVFTLELQVQIHVPDTHAPKVISMVGSMENLVNEVLQAAIGNHFRNTLQGMAAVKFIQGRQDVQVQALQHITEQLSAYNIETMGVYIQDVVLPTEVVEVLQLREIAVQERETFEKQEEAEQLRVKMMHTKSTADRQKELAHSEVEIEIEKNNAEAKMAKAVGEATYTQKTGEAEGAKLKAEGVGRAEGYVRQVEALGPANTALVNVMEKLAAGGLKLPEIVVIGGGSGSTDGLMATAMKYLKGMSSAEPDTKETAEGSGVSSLLAPPNTDWPPKSQSTGVE